MITQDKIEEALKQNPDLTREFVEAALEAMEEAKEGELTPYNRG